MAFRGSAPTKTYREWLAILLRIIFPPLLLWDGLKWLVNYIWGEKIASLILHTLNSVRSTRLLRNEKELQGISKPEVTTYDGVSLDTIEVKHSSQREKKDESTQKYIIKFCGSGSIANLSQLEEEANAFQANMIGFNYRGVIKNSSPPRSMQDLVTDGITQVERLLAKGVSPNNIILSAYSLGCPIAAHVALHFHQLGIPINLFCNKTFSSLTDFCIGWIRANDIISIIAHVIKTQSFDFSNYQFNHTGHKETTSGKIVGYLVWPLVKLALVLTGWEIDTVAAYQAIPETCKSYLVIRSPKQLREAPVNTITPQLNPVPERKVREQTTSLTQREKEDNSAYELMDDDIIPHYASLHMGLKSERQKQKARLDKIISEIKEVLRTTPQSTQAQLQKSLASAQKARQAFKARKMVGERKKWESPGSGLHAQHLAMLKNQDGTTGEQFFKNFVFSVWRRNEISSSRGNVTIVNGEIVLDTGKKKVVIRRTDKSSRSARLR